MASILSKLPRAASVTRASRSAAGGVPGGTRPAAAIRASSAGGPMSSEEEEKARPKSEIAWAANPSQTRDFPLSLEARLASPSCISPKLGDPEAVLYVDENALKSDEAMWAFYEKWCKFHDILRTRREMELRFKNFSESARSVHRASAVGQRKWMNPFVDMTRKEASRRIGRLGTRRK